MDILWFGIAVVVVFAILWSWRRRRKTAAEEWTPQEEAPGSGEAPVPQVLDRDSLVNRNRVLDPSKWDNAPEGTETEDAEEPGDLPRFFDRDYLRRQRDGEPGGGD